MLPSAQLQGLNDAELHSEWRMEGIAHVASLVTRNMYCKVGPACWLCCPWDQDGSARFHSVVLMPVQLEAGRPCDLPEKVHIAPLKEWAAADVGW